MIKNIKILLVLIVFSLMCQSTIQQTCGIQNCIDCVDNKYCNMCSGGLVPNTNFNQCVYCSVPNCQYCSDDNLCNVCLNGYTLYNQKIVANGSNSTIQEQCFKCDVNFCQACDKNSQCVSCISGYQLLKGSCVICSYPCATCTDNMKCLTCSTPYYFQQPDSDGKCFPSKVSNCVKYDKKNSTKCLQCSVFYTLNSTKNFCNKDCQYPCGQCDGSVCKLCLSGFSLDNTSKKCIKCKYGCQQCDSNGCIKAIDGFYLDDKQSKLCPNYCKTCTSSTSCSQYDRSFLGFVHVIINNQSKMAKCDQGCSRCSPSNISKCLQCSDSYALDLNGKCVMCDQSCKTCDKSNSKKCLSCYPYSFKVNDDCITCDSNCLTCQSSSAKSQCISCKQGYHLTLQNTCSKGCPDSCQSCLSLTQCTKCTSGYTLSIDNTDNNKAVCFQCINNCKNCAKGQPANCLDCGDGAYSATGACVLCPVYCKTCSESGCTRCYPGYNLNSDGLSCSPACVYPCQTCSSSNPKICTTCVLGYTLNTTAQTCIADTSCNGSCIYCPDGFANNNGLCVNCKGKNCRTCDSGSLDKCTSCVDGYFLNTATTSCDMCPFTCATCASNSQCLTCKNGYTSTPTSAVGAGFTCLACSPQCATCLDSIYRCTSCVDKYEMKGWRCVKKYRFTIYVRLIAKMEDFYLHLFPFMNELFSKRKSIAFEKIYQGSVVVQGSIDPTAEPGTSSFNSQLSNINTALTQGNLIGGLKIQSSSVSTSVAASPQVNDILGLILGICIPVGILIIASIGLIAYKIKSKKQAMQMQVEKIQDKVATQSQSASDMTGSRYDI